MGLFSSSKKNKHDKLAQNLGQDDGHFSRAEDEAIGAKARAKRASNAGGAAGRGRKDAPDPVLPEKKRARRRLVGAIALAMAAAIGIPMLLDSEPRPLNGDIAIQIPSKEKAAPLPVPQAPAPVDAADTLDKREEIVTAATRPEPAAQPARKPSKYDTELRDEPEPAAVAKVEKKLDAKPEPKPESKVAKADKPADKPKVEKPKPVKEKDTHPLAVKSDENARALAILEDKEDRPPKVDKAPADTASQRFVLQVAALASQEKVTELQAKLAGAGLRSYTQKGETSAGAHVIRVRVGPFSSRDEAEKIRGKLSAMGLSGSMVPL